MKKFAFLMLTIFATKSFAIVDLKNANYSNTWIDMQVPGSGYELKVARTYNSRSLFNGIFGFGWCSDFETKISVSADGNIRLTECGGGLEVLFTPQGFSTKDIEANIAQIVTKAKAANKPADLVLKWQNELKTNSALRDQLMAEYGISTPVRPGTTYYAKGREVEHFILNKDFYTRNLPDGTSMRFDLQGRLTHMHDKNGNFLKMDYDKDLLRQVSDNQGRRLSFKYNTTKRLTSITGPNGLSAEYKFANLDDLAWVKNAWSRVYTYEYDDLHNLTKATWPDNTFVQISYDKNRDWTTSFRDRDGCLETYAYDFNKQDPVKHYWSNVKKTCGTEVVNESKFEFFHKTRADGVTYLERAVTVINGSTTDILYHEVFGRPLSIRKNNDRVAFDYHPNGLLKTKKTSIANFEYEYDQKTQKVSKVTTSLLNEKGAKAGEKISQFKYDPKGNLVYAENSDGQKINLTYDHRGRIASVIDQAKKIVKIEYENRFGKPGVVTRPGLGSISVKYSSAGEIDKVESPQGPQVAVQVASTFNNLLDVIAPASIEVFN